MKTIFKISLILILTVTVSVFVSKTSTGQILPICDPGTPHIEILDYPGTGTVHIEGRYIYQKEYLPTYPNDTEFVELHCGLNYYKIVDPCNPWVLDFYIAFYEDRPFAFDQVKVLKPRTNWDTTICQDMRFDVVYPYDWADSNY